MSVLLRYPFKLDEWTYSRDLHSFDHFHAARQTWLVVLVGLSLGVVPDLAIRTVAVPTKIPIGNCLQREILKTTEQTVLLRHLNPLAEDFNLHQSLKRIQ